jgi:hypothetical protein
MIHRIQNYSTFNKIIIFLETFGVLKDNLHSYEKLLC